MSISKYCQECFSFTKGRCAGIEQPNPVTNHYGTIRVKHLSGLNLCSRYEFDSRCWPKLSSAVKSDTILHAKARGNKKRTEEENLEAVEEFELGASLSSADFEDLLV